MARRPVVDIECARKHVTVLMSSQEHQQLLQASARLRRSMSAIAKDAINAYLVGQLTYFYVQTAEGFIPPATEVGFLDFTQARNVAVAHRGQVVLRHWIPATSEVL